MSGRKVETVQVPDWPGNRDAGKLYVIKEMSAAKAEKWALRAFLALKGSSERVPEGIAALGMVGVAIVGLNVFLRAEVQFGVLEPLLDEMMECVSIIRDHKRPDVATPLATDDDIEEVQTRAWLRSEVLRLHTGFSLVAAVLDLMSQINARQTDDSSTTSTSPPS